MLAGHLDTVFPADTDVKVKRAGTTLRVLYKDIDTAGRLTTGSSVEWFQDPKAQASARERLQQVLDELGLQELQQRFGA